ncbi:nucleotidyltransferase family protein [Sulfuricurvum sp.]|uniref:nucleotidyltransferase family protein n=1 Tax=Sulfuricurvum sp. TaxID=2025608 RepID=UPI00356A2A8D
MTERQIFRLLWGYWGNTKSRLEQIFYEYARIHAMNTQYEIVDFLQNNRKLLLEKYHVTKIGLFGSFARNEQQENSDVDLLIELEEGTQNIYDLKDSLKQFLSLSFNRSVDIAREKYLKPYAREQILKDTLYV